MSLTTNLDNPNSVVSRFLKEKFPQTRSVLADHNRDLKQVETIGRTEDLKKWYATLGTAIDYRLRYYFPPEHHEELVAHQGALRAAYANELGVYVDRTNPHELLLTHDNIDEFFDHLARLLDELQPAAKRLSPEHESELCRYCFILALFEQVFRAGLLPTSPLFSMAEPSVEALLGLAPEACVEDLCTQSWLFFDRFVDRIHTQYVLNPTFDGSVDVGGADADLILDGCLIDFKSTINPKLTGKWLHQLLGYALLDYTDEYCLTSVGIYLSRQGVLLRWDLPGLIERLTGGSPRSLNELREQFSSLDFEAHLPEQTQTPPIPI